MRSLRIALLAAGLMCPLLAQAGPRSQREYGADDGLHTGGIHSLTFDAHGYLWAGGNKGLVRFDGREFEAVAQGEIEARIYDLVADSRGRIYAYGLGESVWRVDGESVVELLGPEGQRLGSEVEALRVDPMDGVWAFGSGGAFRWPADGQRAERPFVDGRLASTRISELTFEPETGTPIVAADDRVWRVPSGQEASVLVTDVSRVTDLHYLGDELYVLTHHGDLRRRVGDEVEVLEGRPGPRGIDLLSIGERLWISNDSRIGYVDRGGPVRWTKVAAGGRLAADPEGGLWMGRFSGLVQFPDPDTRIWDTQAGMIKAHTRFLTPFGDGVAVSAWNEPGYVVRSPESELEAFPGALDNHAGRPCNAANGDVLYLSRHGVERYGRETGRVLETPIPYGFSCTLGPTGRAWLGYRAGVTMVPPSGDAREIELPAEFDDGVEIAFEDHRGRLWLTRGERLCQGDADVAAQGQAQEWSCSDFPDSNHAFDLLSFEDGQVWMATDHAGLLLFDGDEWRPHPGLDASWGQTFGSLSHAPSGGVWLATPGGPIRVERDPTSEAPYRLRVVEHLTHWHGLPTDGVGDVLEVSDGSLYLTTWRGLVWIPEKTRRRQRPAPILRLDRVVSGGVESSKGRSLALEYGENDLQLHFRAPVFRDARLLRFRVRMNADEAWGAASSGNSFNFVNLSPGEYSVQAQAQIEGGEWSEPTTAYVFTVERPWFWSPWPWLGALALFGCIGYIAYRTRVAFLLRMERQRMQIAMDLHDEVGSGLGSIGLLANVAADFPGEGEARRELVEQIAETATSLGTSMSDIVWSLRPEAGQLRSLAARLHERGNLLFPTEHPRLKVVLPETWPSDELGLTVRRNLYAIAVEAMHNAAKHAEASEVELELSWNDAEFSLCVRDDGSGFDYAAKSNAETGGLGLRSMRLRAEDMGARLHVGPGIEGRGTSVEVRLARKKSQREARKSRLT